MATTTERTRAQKKPHPAPIHADADHTKKMEQATMELEDVVFHVLSADKGHQFHDVDFLYWNRRLKNIATQISLALSECRGPRVFHQHYRHDPDNYEALYPVHGPSALETLTRVCRDALMQCSEMVGIQDAHALSTRGKLEQAIRGFLSKAQRVN